MMRAEHVETGRGRAPCALQLGNRQRGDRASCPVGTSTRGWRPAVAWCLDAPL